MDNLPHNSTNPRIVLGYNNQIKLMIDQTNHEKWTKKDFEQLEKCKIQYLEEKLGHKITKLEDTISHKAYEANLKTDTDFYKKVEEKSITHVSFE